MVLGMTQRFQDPCYLPRRRAPDTFVFPLCIPQEPVRRESAVPLRQCRATIRYQGPRCWLYGVAYRVSLEARTRSARRRVHEKQVKNGGQANPLAEVITRDLRL